MKTKQLASYETYSKIKWVFQFNTSVCLVCLFHLLKFLFYWPCDTPGGSRTDLQVHVCQCPFFCLFLSSVGWAAAQLRRPSSFCNGRRFNSWHLTLWLHVFLFCFSPAFLSLDSQPYSLNFCHILVTFRFLTRHWCWWKRWRTQTSVCSICCSSKITQYVNFHTCNIDRKIHKHTIV